MTPTTDDILEDYAESAKTQTVRRPKASTTALTPVAVTHTHEVDEEDYPSQELPTTSASTMRAEYARVVNELKQPLDRSLVRQRKGYGTGQAATLDYLEWHTVTRQLNRIFGHGRWDVSIDEVTPFGHLGADGIPRAVMVKATLTVNFTEGYGTTGSYQDIGYDTVQTRRGEVTWEAFEMALGNAKAKAFKRAAAQLGDQFGLSLYEKTDDERARTAEETTHTTAKVTVTPVDENLDVAECENCGKAIRGYTNKNGRTYTTAELVNMSRKFANGRVLCLDCRNA